MARACDHVGMSFEITKDPDVVRRSQGLVLPGMGAFGDAMKMLNESGLSQTIIEACEQDKPFLGICLGMQLLMDESEEFGTHKGLGIISGKVVRFQSSKVPFVGWHEVRSKSSWTENAVEEFSYKWLRYFVHSYYVSPETHDVVLSETKYEDTVFCSSLKRARSTRFSFIPKEVARMD